MYDYLILNMAKEIYEAKASTVDQIAGVLFNFWEERIAITWCIDDVQSVVHAAGRKITKDQAANVLERVLNKHDAEFGVNWETLRFWAFSLLDEEGEPDEWEEGWEPDDG